MTAFPMASKAAKSVAAAGRARRVEFVQLYDRDALAGAVIGDVEPVEASQPRRRWMRWEG